MSNWSLELSQRPHAGELEGASAVCSFVHMHFSPVEIVHIISYQSYVLRYDRIWRPNQVTFRSERRDGNDYSRTTEVSSKGPSQASILLNPFDIQSPLRGHVIEHPV